jgi:hypothetical protein
MGLLSSDPMTALVDTCASLCVTPHKKDFIDFHPVTGRVMKGLSAGAQIAGKGFIEWNVEVGGKVIPLRLRAVLVPAAQHRLLCPQQVIQELFPQMKAHEVDGNKFVFHFPEGDKECPYNGSNLPELDLCSPKELETELQSLSSCLIKENNHNLKAAQKELLKWHWKFGHINLKKTQALLKSGVCGTSPLIKAAANLSLEDSRPLCGSCLFGKAKKRRSKVERTKGGDDGLGRKTASDVKQEKLLSKDAIRPGQKVSMDHFIVSTPGRLFSSRGRDSFDKSYKGGVIFVDHASNFIHVVPVVNFTAGEALRAKREFEAEMSSMGVTVLHYHTDNGVFTASQFQDQLAKEGQGISFSGVGAHHQNAVAERAIGTVTSMSRTMMLHAKMRWPKAVTTNLWPMAMKHAQHLLNHMPTDNNVCPLDIVLGTTVPRTALRNLHVWGAPCFVLDPKLQDGHKIPKFDSRSRQALHLGLSPRHAATVPLVLNLETGNVSPQFHVVFDDWFSTVNAADTSPDDSIDDEQWTELFMNERFKAHFDDEDPVELEDEWLTQLEQQERHEKAVAKVQRNQHDSQQGQPPMAADLPNNPLPPVPSMLPGEHSVTPAPMQEPPVPSAPTETPAVAPQQPQQQQREQRAPTRQPSRGRNNPGAVRQLRSENMKLRSGKTVSGAVKGLLNTLTCFVALLNADPVMTMAKDLVGLQAAIPFTRGFDGITGTFDEVDPISFNVAQVKSQAKKGADPDFPTFWQVMSSPDVGDWMEAMQKEIETLMKLGTWEVVPRAEVEKMGHKIIKSTWAFRQKRSPDGTPTKKKARFCVRGDHQNKLASEGGLDPFESFSPVVQWSSVRLMLILSIVHGLETRQVDYVNAFAQADLNKNVFVELPQGFKHDNDVPCVLWLKKSLYGMSDAPLMFFELLKSNLQAIGFKQLEHIDPCLFVHPKAICLSYVDDCLWFGRDGAELDKLIKRMKDERKMDLKIESNDVSAFLGIQFTRKGSRIELKQLGLIDKIIQDTGMEDCNPAAVPADSTPLGKDKNGAPCSEQWNYRSVVGRLLYLSGNSRPDIAFAVHQVARFSHEPKHSHEVAVKRIVRYLKGTRNRGLVFRPRDDWKIDCYVDADFCGLWGAEDPDDPVVAKSRTGFILTLAGCPLMWVSKLQTEVSVSTMMAEYVALSTAMRDMLPLKRLVRSVAKVVTGQEEVEMNCLSDVFEDNNGALTVATTPRITPQSKFFAVKLHFFKSHVKTEKNPNGDVNIVKIATNLQLADIMTKGLVEAKFAPLRDKLMGWDLDPQGSVKEHLHDDKKAGEANVHSRGSVAEVRPSAAAAEARPSLAGSHGWAGLPCESWHPSWRTSVGARASKPASKPSPWTSDW